MTKSREIRSSVASRERWGEEGGGGSEIIIFDAVAVLNGPMFSLSLSYRFEAPFCVSEQSVDDPQNSESLRNSSFRIYLFIEHTGAKGGEEGKQNYRQSTTRGNGGGGLVRS